MLFGQHQFSISYWRVFLLFSVVAFGFLAKADASVDTIQFTTSPVLFPAFDATISDYVVRTTGTTTVQVTVTNSDPLDTTTTVSVDGAPAIVGGFSAQVTLDQGQGFKIAVVQDGTSKDYFVRTLGNGFPTWGSERPGAPQAEFYVVAPSDGVGAANRYITIYDTNGVPIWWTRPPNPHRPIDAKILPNGEVLWTESDTTNPNVGLKAEHRRLDGSIVDDSIAASGYEFDVHDVQRLDNGNYLVIGSGSRCCYNLVSHGGPPNATIRDCILQEVTSDGTTVWTWLASDHIGIDETQQQWWTAALGTRPVDAFHINSAVMDAAHDLLISLRHTNAIYKVANPQALQNPGKIIWKLGGSPSTIEPGTLLTVLGDPIFSAGGGFGGQHYARWFDAGDGQLYVTLHDNGTNLGRPPRGVMYQINEEKQTATLMEDVRDNASPNMTSACCGSAAKLPSGNWVMSWGGRPLVTELTPSGDRAVALTFGVFSYRVDPVPSGTVTRAQLRAGMDAQYPRPTPTPSPTPTPTPTPTETPTPTPTPTATATATATPSPTSTPTATPPPPPIYISGKILYCSTSGSVSVPNVTLILTGDSMSATVSDSSGDYQFLNLVLDDSYVVTPSKPALLPGNSKINTTDVVATQRHFLHITLLPPGCQQTAADTNGDGLVNTVDVIAIQRFFLGLATGIAKTGQYHFTPENRVYSSLSTAESDQDYYGARLR